MRGARLGDQTDALRYMPGFGNTHSTEAEPGALPIGRNSPQRAPLGLYAEVLSGTAFTVPRDRNQRSWLYRILPSVRHAVGFEEIDAGHLRTAPSDEGQLPFAQLRWGPVPLDAQTDHDFVDGLVTIATCGHAASQTGMASHVYTATRSMAQRCFMNADGEMLFVPEMNAVRLVTEFGVLLARPGDIAVIPRGVKFRLELPEGPVRGYICENYGGAFRLPERGPIGANHLANDRDFLYPLAAYEDRTEPHELFCKKQGRMFRAELPHSPLDVVAWHGNYAPYKYDLRRFATIGSISFDHPDPSIFTVLTSPSASEGTANVDFVIFPDRWLVMEDTFRPPWYHVNVMSEFMGLVYGVYDAKPGGFVPGAMSLHNAMIPHGPDQNAFEGGSSKTLEPEKLSGTLAFMFETCFTLEPTRFAATALSRDETYADCWSGLRRQFSVG
ncbi:MAG: homogentisate 1,2-dioxygenase [Pseudomonadota bacterium]